jgi:hypothetical protein
MFSGLCTESADGEVIAKKASESLRMHPIFFSSAILAAAAGGSLSDIETTVAMTAKDAAATFESAGKAAKDFRSAGRS